MKRVPVPFMLACGLLMSAPLGAHADAWSDCYKPPLYYGTQYVCTGVKARALYVSLQGRVEKKYPRPSESGWPPTWQKISSTSKTYCYGQLVGMEDGSRWIYSCYWKRANVVEDPMPDEPVVVYTYGGKHQVPENELGQ